jgi:phosphatidylinositol alpha-1,6-mannosyltransferase
MTNQVLLLTPSRGLGGGIERYVETLEWAFTEERVTYRRIDLGCTGTSGHARMLAEASSYLKAGPGRSRLILAHRALLPVAALLTRRHRVEGVSVICHGSDVWGARLRPRWYVERRLMRRTTVRLVAVSSFTSGAVSAVRPATILPPGLSREWFNTLVSTSHTANGQRSGVHLITAFRLTDWRDKGLPEILQAVAALGRPDVRLTVCGTGQPPPELLGLVRKQQNCTLMPGLTDQDLARELASADLFVLATRTRPGRQPSGEGFGLVLLEAQVAGTPVVAPAYGGSHDAYVHGVTGDAPIDETAGALGELLDRLLRDPDHLARMSKRAEEWARECFAPERYAALAVDRLL